jgi:hypothetical protein
MSDEQNSTPEGDPLDGGVRPAAGALPLVERLRCFNHPNDAGEALLQEAADEIVGLRQLTRPDTTGPMLVESLRVYAAEDDYIRSDGSCGQTIRGKLMRSAASEIDTLRAEKSIAMRELAAMRLRAEEAERKRDIYKAADFAMQDQAAELTTERDAVLRNIERLRGLCKTAVGMLHDADRTKDAETIHALIGDI